MSAPVRAVAATARYPNKVLLTAMFGTGGQFKLPTFISKLNLAIANIFTPSTAVAIATYIQSQLTTGSKTMDRFFDKYNTPESEASRQKTFQGHPDPRTNILNFLSWK